MTSLPARALIEKLQKTAKCIYIATDKVVADEVSATCNEAATALLAAHSELERVREALTAINRRLSNGGLTFDELIREAAYSASIARAALSPQPPKEEK
jgi:hypothetical protein